MDYSESVICDGFGKPYSVFFATFASLVSLAICNQTHSGLLEWVEKVTWLLTILLVMGEYSNSGWRYGEDSQSDA